MKICHFLKVLILFPLIFFTNVSTTTYAQTFVTSPKYTYKSNVNMNYDELVVVSCSNDIDGDNLKESIELIYNGDFILKIDDKQIIVEKNVYYCPRNILLCPNLEILDESHAKYKTIIVSYSDAIHQINPTVQIWIYQYKNKDIRQTDPIESSSAMLQ